MASNDVEDIEFQESPAKRQKLENDSRDVSMKDAGTASQPDPVQEQGVRPNGGQLENQSQDLPPLRRGEAPVKAEYRLPNTSNAPQRLARDDDEAESTTLVQSGSKDNFVGANGDRGPGGGKKNKKAKGQNKARTYGSWGDTIKLCNSRVHKPEFSPEPCRFGDGCSLEHDIRRYMAEGKDTDIQSFDGQCPIWDVRGFCNQGWKCRWVGSHSKERETEDGKKELILLEDEDRMKKTGITGDKDQEVGVFNLVSQQQKFDLQKRAIKTPKADEYIKWLTESWNEGQIRRHNGSNVAGDEQDVEANGADMDDKEDNRAAYVDPPFLPSEKRRLYYGPETPVLAPLTTQGNLPFRRLCVGLGAQVTWSEMAMGMPLIQGHRPEWALMKVHESELTPPKCNNPTLVSDYNNKTDLKFGAQIAANKPWVVYKTTEIMTKYLPHLRAIDLNCGCPIDLVYKEGAGSALMDNPSKLEKMVRGMNALSGEIPITVKLRTGTRDNNSNADSIVKRLVLGGHDAVQAGLGACGVAAITLHGRSRQQRYTKTANWEYIAEVASIVKRLHAEQDRIADTVREPDERQLANGGKVFFMGNGDCFSHKDYYDHIEHGKVDSVMVGRGALIKPWIFEEIESGQYLDKSASERLSYMEKFVRYGLETWGSDETGVGTTRRFLLEWLSFSYRYVPLGILERLPPLINERPPRFKGRNDLETLLASPDYRDWIKISEMFLGPAHKDFRFAPKHKSNSYDIEAEG